MLLLTYPKSELPRKPLIWQSWEGYGEHLLYLVVSGEQIYQRLLPQLGKKQAFKRGPGYSAQHSPWGTQLQSAALSVPRVI